MVFSEDFGAIVGGGVTWRTSGETSSTSGGAGSTMSQGARGTTRPTFARYGVHLLYRRLPSGFQGTETSVKDVLLQMGMDPSSVDEALVAGASDASGAAPPPKAA